MSNIGSQFQTESVTPLGNAATATGAWRSMGDSPTEFVYFVAEATADQTGTLIVEKSNDMVTAYPVNGAGAAMTANVTATVAARITAKFYRARVVNGATPQTSFSFMTSATTA